MRKTFRTDDAPASRSGHSAWRIFILLTLWSLPASAASPGAFPDAPIGELRALFGGELFALCRTINMPCGFENAYTTFELMQMKLPQKELHFRSANPRKVLDELVRRNPGHHWRILDGMLMVEPNVRAHEDMLGRRLDHVSIHGSSWMGARYVLRRAKIGCLPMPLSMEYFGSIDLELSKVTVREALNAIAKADEKVVWQYTAYKPGKSAKFTFNSWRTSGIDISAVQDELKDKLNSEGLGWHNALRLRESVSK